MFIPESLYPGKTLYIVNKADGHLSVMTVEGWINALSVGQDWRSVVVLFDDITANYESNRYKTIAAVVDIMKDLKHRKNIDAILQFAETVNRQDQ